MGKLPARSRILREKTVAYAESKGAKGDKGKPRAHSETIGMPEGVVGAPPDVPDAATGDAAGMDILSDAAKSELAPPQPPKTEEETAVEDAISNADITPKHPLGDPENAVADAMKDPPKQVDEPKQAEKSEAETAVEDAISNADITAKGATAASPPAVSVAAPALTDLPGPKDVPAGSPDDAAPPPGRVPAGDSRSLRNGNEFALVYRLGTAVISRYGTVGRRGVWRVVEYPTPSSASSGYAKETSRFIAEGFLDYRD